MSKEKTICPKCGKYLVPYIKSSNLCQTCYRELLQKYSFFEYRPDVKKPKPNTKADKIVSLAYNDHLDSKEISNIMNTNQLYVIATIRKHLYRCDVNGTPRPRYMEKK